MTYPQQGGYGPPQGGGYGPPPPPQGGGYGPPQPPGGGYGYPPPGPGGYGQYPPPRKNNTGLVVGAVGVAVAAVVALVLVLALSGDDDDSSTADGDGTSQDSDLPNGIPGPNGGGDSGDDSGGGSGDGEGGGSEGGGSTPEALADLVVVVVETQNEELVDEHACSSGDASQMKMDLARLDGMAASGTVDEVDVSDDSAQAVVSLSIGGQAEATLTADMELDGDAWCVSGIQISN